METNEQQAIIEAILYAAGRQVETKELMAALELSEDEIKLNIEKMQEEYAKENRGIEIIKIEDSYQLCTKTKYYEYIYPIFDKRAKPTLSPAALEVISIIAYNPKITRAEKEIATLQGLLGSDESQFVAFVQHLTDRYESLNFQSLHALLAHHLKFL